jgi:UDP-3-O-[3-hydroxymyristoyl] glucosamine N-acyltransferase
MTMEMTLSDLAAAVGADLDGDGDLRVSRVASLDRAEPSCIAFFADQKYRSDLKGTRAGAVVLRAGDLADCPVAALVSPDPHLTFAYAARLLHPPTPVVGGRHPSAVIADGADIHPSAWIGPLVVVEEGAEIGPRVFVGPGSLIGARCRVGEDSRLVARVTLCEGTVVGKRALLHPGCVIGREGFGFARDGGRWLRVPQLGRAILGDDVEVGVNSAVDRGALGDTVIADGVKIDSLIQIGHNVQVGEDTAMAACSGISGSTRIGRNCTIGGAVGMAGHLEIGDDVHFTGMAMVTRSFTEPGTYSSGIPAMPSAEWRRAVVRFRKLEDLARRLKRLEERLATNDQPLGQDGG